MLRSLRCLTALSLFLSLACVENSPTVLSASEPSVHDPCGMVPPAIAGRGSQIKRIGLQKTYVFFAKGMETIVIRPGFEGRVEEFGMLIPFPSPPAIRKVPDNIFEQIANAIDPPEVVVDMRPKGFGGGGFGGGGGGGFGGGGGGGGFGGRSLQIQKDKVVALKEEAVGMYDVAVLRAGSAKAMKRWMDYNKFKFPKGMDSVTDEYIAAGWCFVAVKTRVGKKANVDPKPGQRNVNVKMPVKSMFDGHVQAMGFRFYTPKIVVPMRLSTFNDGDLRNVVYLLTSGAAKIRFIPEEYVRRQVKGRHLVVNLMELLPIRVLGGDINALRRDVPRMRALKKRRNPVPHNGVARNLFAADVTAAHSKKLALPHEEQENELLRINERFRLRDPELDKLVSAAIEEKQLKEIGEGMMPLLKYTLTVVDGDFPREVLAGQNLTFANYKMPQNRNNPKLYRAQEFGPPEQKLGKLFHGKIDILASVETLALPDTSNRYAMWHVMASAVLALSLLGLITNFVVSRRKI